MEQTQSLQRDSTVAVSVSVSGSAAISVAVDEQNEGKVWHTLSRSVQSAGARFVILLTQKAVVAIAQSVVAHFAPT